MKNIGWFIVAIAIVGALGFYFYQRSAPSSKTPEEAGAGLTRIASVAYSCDEGHAIQADYYQGPAAPEPEPGQPPVPTGKVEIRMDGGPVMTLAQTLSADGVRYSDGNPQIPQGQPGAESLVFWNKGDTALVLRDNAMDLTYKNCVSE